MKSDVLLDAFGQIEDKFIVEAMPKEKEKKKFSIWMPKIAIAASVCLLVGVTVISQSKGGFTKEEMNNGIDNSMATTESIKKEDYSNTNASTSAGKLTEPEETMDIVIADGVETGNELPNWGLSLSAENVTSTGLVLICTQADGELTGQLQTGSEYQLFVLKDEVWEEVPVIIENFGWNTMAYLIPVEDSVEFEINWEWLYGKLPAGIYRIQKEFVDFRKTSDYDTVVYGLTFEIEDN